MGLVSDFVEQLFVNIKTNGLCKNAMIGQLPPANNG